MATDISLEELQQRHERVRSFVADQGLGALFVYSPPQEHKWGQTRTGETR